MNRTQHGSVFPNSILFLLYRCNIFSNHYIRWFVCLTSSRVIFPLESVVSCRESLWEIPPMTRSWRKYRTGKAVRDSIDDEVMRKKPDKQGCPGYKGPSRLASASTVGLPGLAGGPDLGFGFPWNGGIPHPQQVTWSQPINMRPVRNKGRAKKPVDA